MSSPRGELYETLVQSTEAERRAIATDVMSEMRDGSPTGETPTAHYDYLGLCTSVFEEVGATNEALEAKRSFREFSTLGSASLVLYEPRVTGFLRAIDRVPYVQSAIDAGTGASALLAVGIATLHPEVEEVHAYELNPLSVECAERLVSLFGLERRIRLHEADVLTTPLPCVDLGVTETFGAGLLREDGPQITHRLAQVATHILPARVRLYATDLPGDDHWPPTPTVTLDLRANNDLVQGDFLSARTSPSPANVRVYANFYDAQDGDVVTGFATDPITAAATIGELDPQTYGRIVHFDYLTGVRGEEPGGHQVWVS